MRFLHRCSVNTDIRSGIDMTILRYLALGRHAQRFAQSFFHDQGTPISTHDLRQAKSTTTHIARIYHGFGFKSRYHLGSFVYWALALNTDFETRTPLIQDQIRRTDADPNERFVLVAREMKALFGPKIRTYRGYGS